MIAHVFMRLVLLCQICRAAWVLRFTEARTRVPSRLSHGRHLGGYKGLSEGNNGEFGDRTLAINRVMYEKRFAGTAGTQNLACAEPDGSGDNKEILGTPVSTGDDEGSPRQIFC